ncbi:DoxX family protein [Brevundimonas sp.]|jgi:putative oxidoreductase|uniref:DoxX family protein n=1 Tax=Brevundimonas sp. TaxID=1871086 RepID=UPI002E1071D4|nr:DoxX family protein [Brevundimonas sp.]
MRNPRSDHVLFSRFADEAVLLLRLYLGGFLIWGVWDNVTSAARMAEFQAFLAGLNCPLPAVAAPVSVYAQLLVGILLVPGFLTRWAGLLLAVNFAVAVVLLATGLEAPGEAVAREVFGPMMCVLAGLILATGGPGRWSMDARFRGG